MSRETDWLDFWRYKQEGPLAHKVDPARCAMSIQRSATWAYYQCPNKVSTERCGTGLCGIHARRFDRNFKETR